ncbi:lipopolysaccharide transport system permease protein [Paramicrobacterium humi]|uniref:Transport permease protein n=1 Tax=Paramicrobacterium humi TaxID=640635 RepID=A0A1H4MMU2_9MICO|nr:lipopolysaccharide transport system permease protein [Microbacterium humi]
MPPWREFWEAREVLYRFGIRDIVLRYRQTAVGVAWVVLQPLAAAGIFSIVFGQVAGLSSGDVPYFVFSFAGMLAWNVFNGVVSRASSSLVANQTLVSKVFFPRLLVPLSSAISVVLDFLVAFVMLIVLLIVFGVTPGWAVLLTPVWLVITLLLGCGVGVAASAITVKYRDVTYVLPWVLQILLYATPIAYSLSEVPSNLLWAFELNPLTWLMEAVRWSLLGQEMPPLWQLIGLPLGAALVFFGGVLLFQRHERAFADFI